MPRPSTIGLNTNLSPGPQQATQVNLPTDAPLIVDQGKSQADYLASALGLVSDAAQSISSSKRQDWADQGEADAAAGKPADPLLMKVSPDYHQNFLKQTTQARWNLYSAHVKQEVSDFVEQTPTATPEDVDSLVQKRYQEFALGPDGQPSVGMDEASVARSIVPQMSEFRSQMVQGATEAIKEKADTNFMQAVSVNADAAYNKTKGVDWNGLHDSLFKAVGGPKANVALAQIATTLASKYHDPSVISSLPQTWADKTPGLMSTQFGDNLAHARDAAQSDQRTDQAQSIASQKVVVLNAITDGLARGQAPTDRQLAAKGSDGRMLLSPEEQHEYHMQGFAAQDSFNKSNAISQALARGDGSVHLLVGSRAGAATKGPGKVASPIVDEDIQHVVDTTVGALPPAQQIPAAFDMANRNGYAYTPLKSFLSAPNLGNPQAFQSQLQVYKTMQSASPGTTHLFLDDTADTVYRAAAAMDDGTMTPEQLMAAVATRDPKQQPHIDTLSKEIQSATTSMTFPGFWGFRTSGSGVQNPGVLSQAIADKATALVNISPTRYTSSDQAIKDATQAVRDQFIVVNGYAVRKTADMGDASTLEKAWNAFSQQAVPNLLKGRNIDPANVVIQPDGLTEKDNNSMGVYLKGTMLPLTQQRFTFQQILAWYSKDAHDSAVKSLSELQAKNQQAQSRYIDMLNAGKIKPLALPAHQ